MRHARLSLCALTVAAALAACAAPCVAQGGAADSRDRFAHGFEHYEPWYLPAGTEAGEARALDARWRALGEELKSTASEFAGDYHAPGAMRDSHLRWAPGGGFVFFYVYEHFAVINFSYGKVTVTPSEIVFTVERERHGSERANPTPLRWVGARWLHRNYLVPTRRIADFGNYVGGFREYNDFNGPCCEFAPFLSAEAREGAAQDFKRPSVPPRFARLMRRPIEATIRFVGRKRIVESFGLDGEFYGHSFGRASLTPVRIDAGRRQGVRPGLLFRLVGAPEGQYLQIRRAGPASSDGVLIRDVDDEDGSENYYDFKPAAGEPGWKPFPPVRVGAKVTTSPAAS